MLEYRVLGKTGLKVSALSLGASSFGGGVFRAVEESEAIQTVKTAIDLGINLIDVSPFYGLTRAETVLGKALRGIRRDRYYLATKVGRYGDTEFDFSARRVTASVDESLRRLGVEYVDLIQSHDNEYGDLNQIINETLPALRKLQETGKVRFVGVTGYPLRIFDHILHRAEIDTILSYNHYSLNDTTLFTLLPLLKDRSVGVINASPLSQGLLTNRGTPAWHPAPEDVKKVCAQAATFCRNRNSDIAKLALQFSLKNLEIATTLVGTADPVNLRKNVEWIEEPVDEDLLAVVMQILNPIMNQTWIVGRPENN
jgi:L-galactose dehydrogenase